MERERWFLFDDTRVKLVGAWADVRLRIERGGYQPTLLFYERNGIKHENLEKIATEIHKWWEATAEDPDDGKKDEVIEKKPAENGVKKGFGAPHEVELGGGLEDELLAKMERSVRITQENPLPPLIPTAPKKIPTSPISLPRDRLSPCQLETDRTREKVGATRRISICTWRIKRRKTRYRDSMAFCPRTRLLSVPLWMVELYYDWRCLSQCAAPFGYVTTLFTVLLKSNSM